MSRFTIKVRNQDSTNEPWIEDFNEQEVTSQSEAEEWARKTLAFFNRTLYDGESPRELVSVHFGEGDQPSEHQWIKQNIFTLHDHRGMFDNLKCKNCGAEARRYGLTKIVRQKKWRARKWNYCQP